jgi:hypothetical protein
VGGLGHGRAVTGNSRFGNTAADISRENVNAKNRFPTTYMVIYYLVFIQWEKDDE